MSTPFVSVVIPTRNRPDFVRVALDSLRAQTMTDFEVIVSDNHTGESCEQVFAELADERFRYVTPDAQVPMHENWEFACAHATGEYVAVLIDKTILRPSALELLRDCAQRFSPDLVSWWADAYTPDNANAAWSPGQYNPWPYARPPRLFDPHEEIARRFRLDVRRGHEAERYFFGKICFGAYHRDLLRRIKERLGRVFFRSAPDYTSMLAALSLARTAVDAGRAGLVQNITQISNGWNVTHRAEEAKRFLLDVDPSGAIFEELPIPGLYSSIHNIVAHDYVSMQRRLGDAFPVIRLDIANLTVRAIEDLRDVRWPDGDVRAEQEERLAAHIAALTPATRLRVKYAREATVWNHRRIRFRGAVRRAFDEIPFGATALRLIRREATAAAAAAPPPARYDSVIQAAAACDRSTLTAKAQYA